LGGLPAVLLAVLIGLACEVLPAPRQRLGPVYVDLDVALDRLDANDLVMDGAERGKDEVDELEEHGVIP
jgi:hypothetical protein